MDPVGGESLGEALNSLGQDRFVPLYNRKRSLIVKLTIPFAIILFFGSSNLNSSPTRLFFLKGGGVKGAMYSDAGGGGGGEDDAASSIA